MRGELPWSLRPSEVWRLCKDGFTVAEIAHIAGVREEVASGMVIEAIPRESPACPQAEAA